jgi:hypothetical protein
VLNPTFPSLSIAKTTDWTSTGELSQGQFKKVEWGSDEKVERKVRNEKCSYMSLEYSSSTNHTDLHRSVQPNTEIAKRYQDQPNWKSVTRRIQLVDPIDDARHPYVSVPLGRSTLK